MSQVIAKRVCAELSGEFVVFLIGMRFNKLWKVASWGPVFLAMPRMIKELQDRPDLGLLHAESFLGLPNTMLVQYWRSFEHLEAFARDPDLTHLPAWRDFNRKIASNGDVGIWHETYQVAPGRYEAIYNNMPRFGLGAAGDLVDAIGAKQAARQRMKAA